MAMKGGVAEAGKQRSPYFKAVMGNQCLHWTGKCPLHYLTFF